MITLPELEKQLASLSSGEKAQVLQWVVRDLGGSFTGIESTAGVCGGEPCITFFACTMSVLNIPASSRVPMIQISWAKPRVFTKRSGRRRSLPAS